jgi:hypothetical protein
MHVIKVSLNYRQCYSALINGNVNAMLVLLLKQEVHSTSVTDIHNAVLGTVRLKIFSFLLTRSL